MLAKMRMPRCGWKEEKAMKKASPTHEIDKKNIHHPIPGIFIE